MYSLPTFNLGVVGSQFAADFPNQYSGSFDGTDDYLTTNQSSLATSGDCTISLWFNSASLPGSGAYDYMFSLTDGRGVGYDRAIGILGTGTDAQIVANTYASGWNLPFTNTSISAGTWYHVAVVFTSGNAQVYLNNVDKGSKSVSTATISYNQTVIGGMLYSSANHFNGKIDEVSVFHSALSSSDIASLYNNGVPGNLSTLSPKGWWRNGDGTGDTASGGGSPASTSVVGTVANQGTVNTGSGQGNMTGTNGATFSTEVPYTLPSITNTYSVSLDGTDDYMDVGTVSNLNGSISAVTLSAWVNISSFGGAIMSGGSSDSDRFYLQALNATTLRYGSGTGFDDFTVPTLSTGSWYHVGLVHNGTTAILYLNGVASGEQTVESPNANYGTAFKVGAYFTGSVYFPGLMDEVSIFTSALTGTDISVIYNSGTPNDISSIPRYGSNINPIAWWRMGDNDGGTGTTITNQGSASSINGTLTNTASPNGIVSGAGNTP